MYQSNNRGVALLVTVVVIGAVSVLVLGALVQTSLSSLTLQSFAQDELIARQRLFSCMDETIAQFRHDVEFADVSVSVGEGICTVSLISDGNDRTVTLTATEENIEKSIEFTLDITTYEFSAFREF